MSIGTFYDIFSPRSTYSTAETYLSCKNFWGTPASRWFATIPTWRVIYRRRQLNSSAGALLITLNGAGCNWTVLKRQETRKREQFVRLVKIQPQGE